MSAFVFFNDTATTEIYPLSLHDALPISALLDGDVGVPLCEPLGGAGQARDRLGEARGEHGDPDRGGDQQQQARDQERGAQVDRKSTRLNSSHANISYAVFCLKKKTHMIY